MPLLTRQDYLFMQEPPSNDETFHSSSAAEASYVQLSRYIDGVLAHEELIALELELENNAELLSQLDSLQTLRGHVFRVGTSMVSGNASGEDALQLPSLWESISEHLLDTNSVPDISADTELLSAYLDNELDAMNGSDGSIQTELDCLLHQDIKASRQLGALRQVSEAVRNFAYRQEEMPLLADGNPYPADTVTEGVLSAFAAEFERDTVCLPQLSDDDASLLSAMLDEELKPQDMILAHKLIERDPAAKSTLHDFTRLSLAIQASIPVWEEQSLVDVQVLMQHVKEDLINEEKVAPISFQQRRKAALKPFWLAAPMIAASVLLVVSWPGLSIDQMLGTSASKAAISRQQTSDKQQLASLPRSLHRSVGKHALSERLSQTDEIPSFPERLTPDTSQHHAYRTIAPPSHPVIDPSVKQMASRRRAGLMDGKAISASHGPSSEAYLFKALDEKSPEDDLTTFLN